MASDPPAPPPHGGSVRSTLAAIRAAAAGTPPPPPRGPPGPSAPYVVPVAVALDREGGHAAVREDVLLPVNASDDAVAGIAAKLCHETGMAGHEDNVARQIADYLGPHRDAAAAAARLPPPSTSRLVELNVAARADGVRVRDRLLWDAAAPASSLAAHAAAVAADLGLGQGAAAALEAALRDAVAKARAGGAGSGVAPGERPAADRGAWVPSVEEDKGGWADAD